MLPSIKVSLPILFLLWVGLGIWAMQGPVMLAYPAMWLGVAIVFLVATKLFGGTPSEAK